MIPYTTLLLSLVVLKIIRHVFLILLRAYTGPLAKIPGPFWYKFSSAPWYWKHLNGTMFKNLNHNDYFKTYGNVVRVAPSEILVAGLEGVQKIVVEDDLIKAPYYERLKPETPQGKIANLITERNRELYKRKRRLLSAGFSISYLNGLEPLMKECVHMLRKSMDKKISESGGMATIDAELLLANLTYDVMAATSLGGSFNLATSESTYLRDLINKRLAQTFLHSTLPYLRYLPFSPPLRVPELDKLLADILDKRRQENHEKMARGEKDQIKRDLLQILVDANIEDPIWFSEDHLKEEVVLFMIAGTDTTSHTLTSALCLLLNNPSKLKALEKEIQTAFPNEIDDITFARTQDLPYLNAVINESLRRMPVVLGGLNRYTEETTTIYGYEVPPKTQVVAQVGALLNDPAVWPDAENFVPERWLERYKGVDVDRRAFLPLGAGRHVCIGQQFAYREMRLVLASIVRRYELILVDGQSDEQFLGSIPSFAQGFYKVGFKLRKT